MSKRPAHSIARWEQLRRLFLFALIHLTLAAGSSVVAEEPGPDFAAVTDRASQMMDDALARHRLPSLVVAVVHDREIIFSRAVGYADLEKKKSATAETVYRVASIVKLITATALVRLAEDGVLRLDDPVSKHIPEYSPRSRFPGARPTTLRQLATHMSGLPRSSYSSFHAEMETYLWVTEGTRPTERPGTTREQFIASLRDLELQYPPNEMYGHYSNLGFTILGVALEEASGQSFVEYAAANILEPLEMSHSGFHNPDTANSHVAVGYVYPDSASAPLIAPLRKPSLAVYSGGMYSTAEDLCRFLSLQFQTAAPGGAQVISADGLRMMQWQSMDWAFHWDAEHPSLSHGAGVPGFGAHVIIIPGLKLGIAALTNTMNTLDIANPTRSVAREIIQIVKKAVMSSRTVGHFSADSVDIDKYVGEYILGDGDAKITISKAGNDLVYTVRAYPQLSGKILPMAPDQFYFEADTSRTYRVVFETDKHGKTLALLSGFHRFRIKGD